MLVFTRRVGDATDVGQYTLIVETINRRDITLSVWRCSTYLDSVNLMIDERLPLSGVDVVLCGIRGDKTIRLGFEGPRSVKIVRHDAKHKEPVQNENID